MNQDEKKENNFKRRNGNKYDLVFKKKGHLRSFFTCGGDYYENHQI